MQPFIQIIVLTSILSFLLSPKSITALENEVFNDNLRNCTSDSNEQIMELDSNFTSVKGKCTLDDGNILWVVSVEEKINDDTWTHYVSLLITSENLEVKKRYSAILFDVPGCTPVSIYKNLLLLSCENNFVDEFWQHDLIFNLSNNEMLRLNSTGDYLNKLNKDDYHAEIYLYNSGIVHGSTWMSYGEYKLFQFLPNNPINRAEYTKIIVGASFNSAQEDNDCVDNIILTDIEAGSWYEPYVQKAFCNSLIDGYPDGTFRPADTINFVEAAKIVVNAFGLSFDYAQDDMEWFEPYIHVLSEQNAIPLSITSLDQKITRGEMAEIVYRLHAGVTDLPSADIEKLLQ